MRIVSVVFLSFLYGCASGPFMSSVDCDAGWGSPECRIPQTAKADEGCREIAPNMFWCD